MRLEYTARQTQLLATDTTGRELSGMALPYGVDGNTSQGRVTVDAGALRIPDNLRRVKLFTEHGRTTPVGYATRVDDTPSSLDMGFRVAATPAGDAALLEAAEGVRDALSVELDNVVIRAGHVTAADLVAVALTSIPAYADARLSAADTPEENPVADFTGQITGSVEGQITDATADTPSPDTEASAPAGTVRAAAGPSPLRAAPRPARSLGQVAELAGQAIAMGDTAGLQAALTDIKWSDGAGAAGAPPQALGELWEGVGYARKVVPNTTYSTGLRSMTVGGFVWNPQPTVAPYAGNKAAVPSTAAAWVFSTHTTQRLAGANDIDRAYDDLAVPGFWEGYWRCMAESYAQQSDAYVLNAMLTGGTAAVPADDVWSAIVNGLVAVSAYGGTPHIAVSANQIPTIATTPATDIPFLLGSMFRSVDDLIQVAPPGFPDDQVTVWSQSAVTTLEAGSVPIRVQAVNLPNGGIDAGLFGYIAAFVTQPAAVVSYTLPAIVP